MRQIHIVGAVAIVAFSALWAPVSPRPALEDHEEPVIPRSGTDHQPATPDIWPLGSATTRPSPKTQQTPKSAFMLDVDGGSQLRPLQSVDMPPPLAALLSSSGSAARNRTRAKSIDS